MKNRKLYIFISMILIFTLIFVACGKKSTSNDPVGEEKEDLIENNIIEEDEKKEEPIDVKNETDKTTYEDKSLDTTVQNTVKDSNNTVNITSKNQSTDNNKNNATAKNNKKPTVTISIVGPKDAGTILESTKVEIEDGFTVFDVLKKVTKDKKIQMEFTGRKSNAYVQGINNIYEFDNGPESGWIYRVNGNIPQVSCGGYSIKENDNIEWLYTTDLGREFGAKVEEGGEN